MTSRETAFIERAWTSRRRRCSIEHGSPFHECGVAATAGLDTHHCRPDPRTFMPGAPNVFMSCSYRLCRQSGTLLAPALHRMLGKIRAGIWPNSGRGFRMGWVAESATRNIALKRDAVSRQGSTESASHSEAAKRDALSARQNLCSRVERQPRYSPRISAASSSWVSTT